MSTKHDIVWAAQQHNLLIDSLKNPEHLRVVEENMDPEVLEEAYRIREDMDEMRERIADGVRDVRMDSL